MITQFETACVNMRTVFVMTLITCRCVSHLLTLLCTGDQLRWDEGEEINALQTNGSVQRAFGGGGRFKNVDRQDLRHVAGGTTNSSAEEEADEVFESEFVMLKDLWKFDSVPFPVTKQVEEDVRVQKAQSLCMFQEMYFCLTSSPVSLKYQSIMKWMSCPTLVPANVRH